MYRKTIFLSIFLLLLAGSFLLREENQEHVQALPLNFTVPTRTPTSPPPPPPTQPPSDDGGGNNNPNPTQPPAETSAPTAIPTTVILAPTPEGGYLPTAEPCDTNPTVTAQTLTNVRSGPGTAYDVIGEIVFLEVRPIVGRAPDTNWWKIVLIDGRMGWVSNSVVQYSGNISVIPIVEAPPIDGVTPTLGVPWIPLLPAGCTPLPTWTPVPLLAVTVPSEQSENDQTEPTVEQTAVSDTPAAAPAEPTASNDAAEEPTAELAAVPLITDQIEDTQLEVEQPVATAIPLPQTNNNAPTSNSIFLIFGAIILVFIFGIALLRTYQFKQG